MVPIRLWEAPRGSDRWGDQHTLGLYSLQEVLVPFHSFASLACSMKMDMFRVYSKTLRVVGRGVDSDIEDFEEWWGRRQLLA